MSKKFLHYIPVLVIGSLIFALIVSGFAKPYLITTFTDRVVPLIGKDSSKKDTIRLPYPINDYSQDPMLITKKQAMDLKTPEVYDTHYELDSSFSNYKIYNTIGGLRTGGEQTISLSEFIKENNRDWQKDYFKDRTKKQNFVKDFQGLIPKINIKSPIIEKILGGGIEIKPQGSAELIFSYDYNKVSNPSWSVRQQKTGQFKFDQKIKLNVNGNIGNKIKLNIGYDTESSFDFDNEIKLRFDGEEDDIVKQLEIGNFSLPVQGTLIQGSQSLFGVKAKLQFGKLTMTTVLSQQRSEKKEINLENGAQKTNYSISSLDYDANRNFFLNQYFRNNIYEQALSRLPIIASPIQISRIEVWMINKRGDYRDTRNIVAFMDLGEPSPWNSSPDNPQKGSFVTTIPGSIYPSNKANSLYEKLTTKSAFRYNATISTELSKLNNNTDRFYNGQDYIKIDNARKLATTEYTVNNVLGYISLNQRLEPGYALAVAYEYTVNGAVFQVGEFAQDVPPDPDKPNVLYLQMLKSTSTRTDLPLWDLMMKNIYNLGSSQIQPNDFKLDIIYEDDKSGANLNYLPENSEPKLASKFLIQVLGLDRLNSQQELQSDGIFDFLEGRTIITGSGKIMFPVLEPFGKTLRSKFNDQQLANKYVFQAIYDSTQVAAEQLKQFDKFYLRGYYLGTSGSEISLNAINVPEGSVKVTAGGLELTENIDYTVDYSLGKVKIINQSILNSGQPIKITAESQSLVSLQQKTLIGSRFDYRINQDFNIGGTFLYLKEKPLTKKVNIGDEPISNVIIGVDGAYRTDSRFLTKLIDKLPLIETKEKSEISISGEFAKIIPGHPKIIGKNGVSYIDDFEGAEVPYDMRTGNYWVLASTPQGQPDVFPNGDKTNSLAYGFGRAKFSWYSIDDLFYRNNQYTPPNISNAMLSNPCMMEIFEKDVFPNKQMPQGIPQTLRTFDLGYYPTVRGPYNFDFSNLNNDGSLKNPKTNWGGIMRKIESNDFEAANIEYIEFWMMDPYLCTKPNNTGKIYIQLGDISEDILKDGLKQYENGLKKENNLKTLWGFVPSGTPINYAFDNDPDARAYQDVGLDGLTDDMEKAFFDSTFIKKLPSSLTPDALNAILKDPSADDYHFFRGDDLDASGADIIERYINFHNTDGNSPVNTGGLTTSATINPDVEDIDNDFTLNEIESYYQYAIEIRPDMQVGSNFIVDKLVTAKPLKDGSKLDVTFYQFKVPIRAYEKRIGQIRDFKSIRFIRMTMNNFEDTVVIRFPRLQLVRGDWRRYLYDMKSGGELIPIDPLDTSSFDISTVNIEANGKRIPIPYVLPPGIEREADYTTTEILQLNEQSMSFNVCGLTDGQAKAAYKTTSFDVRTYKKLKMYVHAEGENLVKGDLSLFIRLGTDFSSNYYEYEIPLDPTLNGIKDPYQIWKIENEINLAFDDLYKAKQQRENVNGSLQEPFTIFDTDHKGRVTVLGNPDLSNVKIVMIGLRNPAKEDNPWNISDDGMPKCGIVWVNELRVSDFDEKGGWAAIGRVTTKLADFGKITLSGNKKTVGFGGLEQKIQERSKEDETGFNFESYLELGKIFPQQSNVKIPMYYNYSQQRIKPEYNPLSPDIKLQTKLDLADSKRARDSILYANETFVSRKGINFTNVQKLRSTSSTNKKARFYGIENFLISYVYSNVYKRDVTTAYDDKSNYKFMLNYMYNFRDYSITPFKKIIKSKRLQPVSNFNINFIPASWSFKTEFDRRYGQVLYRNTDDVQTILKPMYEKNFTMKRNYDFRYNLFKSLAFTYSADVDAYMREPEGPRTKKTRDSILHNIYKPGTIKNFDQRVNLSYDLPFRQFKMIDWIGAKTSYTGGYNWEEAPPAADSLGNRIQNSRTLQFNGQLNFISLYSKVPYLRNISQGKSNLKELKKKKLKLLKEKEKKNGNEDYNKLTEKDVEINEGFYKTTEFFVRLLLSVKTVNINYTINDGIMLPGFMPKPKYIGNDWKKDAPGIPFIIGSQEDIINKVRNGDWLTSDTSLNNLYTRTHSENLVIQGMLEPIKGLKINIDMDRKYNKNYQALYKKDQDGNYPEQPLSEINSGSFSMSFFSWPTSMKGKWNEKISPTYQQFENNRYVISQRLSTDKLGYLQIDDSTHFPIGYSRTSQDVLIPAFLAAYSNKNAATYSLTKFPAIPAPNWRITYSGLPKWDFAKDIIKTFTLNHAYRSTYNISSFATNLNYDAEQLPEINKDFIPQYNMQQISITEQLSPLIGVDINWINNWTSRVEYATNRSLSFSFANYQMNEIRGRDFTIGIGYRANNLKIPVKIKGKIVTLENDFNFRFDFSIKSNRSMINKLDDQLDENQSVGGNRVLTIKPVLEYALSKNLTGKLFFTRTVTKPVISTSYPTAFTSIGFSLRYTLGQ